MKRLLYFLFLLFSAVVLYLTSCEYFAQRGYQDDRLIDNPYNDSILVKLISNCKQYSDRRRNPYFDSTIYYVTFNFFSQNDTDKVWVMGNYQTPFTWHDIAGNGEKDHFLCYFKRDSTYCFFYRELFDSFHNINFSENLDSLTTKMLRDWNQHSEKDNPDFFPDFGLSTMDPYMFEYVIDSSGNFTLSRKGYW